MIPHLSQLATLPIQLSQVFSPQHLLGTERIGDFVSQGNGTVPLASMLSLWLIGGRMFRMRLGLLPIMILILLMLGTDPQASQMVRGLTSPDLSLSAGLKGLNTGWLPMLLMVGGAWLLLGGGGLFSLPNLIGIGAIVYLVQSKDYRLANLLHYQGSSKMLYGLVILGVLLILLRLLRPRYYYPRAFSSLTLAPGSTVRSLLMYCGAVIAVCAVYLILTNPSGLERAIPGWRSGAGVAMLLGSLSALAISLPARWKALVYPLFWGAVSLIIGAQLYAPNTVQRTQHTSGFQEFSHD